MQDSYFMAVATTETNQNIANIIKLKKDGPGAAPVRLHSKAIELMIRIGEILSQTQAIAIYGINPQLTPHALASKKLQSYGKVFIQMLTGNSTATEKLATFNALKHMRFGTDKHKRANTNFYNSAKFVSSDGLLVGSNRILNLINCLYRTEFILNGGTQVFDGGNITNKTKELPQLTRRGHEGAVEQLNELRIKPIESKKKSRSSRFLHYWIYYEDCFFLLRALPVARN